MDKENNQRLLELYGELESLYKELGKEYYNYEQNEKMTNLKDKIFALSEKIEEMEK